MKKFFALGLLSILLVIVWVWTNRLPSQSSASNDLSWDEISKKIAAKKGFLDPLKSPKGDVRKVALILQTTGFDFPDFTQKGIRGTPTDRLDITTVFEPGGETVIAHLGARRAAWAAGYVFEPIQSLKPGETPRNSFPHLSESSKEVLLVRVGSRIMRESSLATLVIFADAALYRRPNMQVLMNAGFITGGDAPISGNEAEDKFQLIVAGVDEFARIFDREVLAPMQALLQQHDIATAITDLKQEVNPTPLMPQITALTGGEERAPELRIATSIPNAYGVIYLAAIPAHGWFVLYERCRNAFRWFM